MTFGELEEYYGIEANSYNCIGLLKDKLENGLKIYCYRCGFEFTKDYKIKKPSVYVFEIIKDGNGFYHSRGIYKQSGNGHNQIGGYTFDNEYQIFLEEQDAIHYATNKLDVTLEKAKKLKESTRNTNIKNLVPNFINKINKLEMSNEDIKNVLNKISSEIEKLV